MSDVVYRIVEHDGGWAYQLDGVFSETFATRQQAEAAASQAAAEQTVPGDPEAIEYQDETGEWHEEAADGSDRPRATVESVPDRRPAQLRTDRPNFQITTLLLAGTAGALMALLISSRRETRD